MQTNGEYTRHRVNKKGLRFSGVVSLAALLGLFVAGNPAQAQGNSGRSSGAGGDGSLYLIEVQPGTNLSLLSKQYNLSVKDGLVGKNVYSVSLQGGNPVLTLERLAHDPRLLRIEPDAVVGTPENQVVDGDPVHVPFDFSYTSTSNYLAASLLTDTGDPINLDPAGQVNLGDAQTLAQGQGVTVAILDTGVLATHPALRSHLIPGYNALNPYTAPDDIADGTTNLVYGHGTMIAGIVAALAPRAAIMPVRVLNADGKGDVISVVQGIRYAVAHGARILNLSFGTTAPSSFLSDALVDAQNAGCIIVAAAGNQNTYVPYYPASYAGVVGVVAIDGTNKKASFSNFGVSVVLCAPGVGIRSTFANGGYASWSGTSFAAPFVSGAAALLFSAQASPAPTQVTRRLWSSAHSLNTTNPAYAGLLGKGLIDIAQSVKATIAQQP